MTAADRLFDYFALFQVLINSKARLRRAILTHSPNDVLSVLSVISFNIIKGTISLLPDELKKLRRNRKFIYSLANRSPKLTDKRKLVLANIDKIPLLLQPTIRALEAGTLL